MTERADVVIMGGGLAGLTLALQLRRQFPTLDVTVLERVRHPVPVAAHKVGESSVEIGARYFDTVLGLEEHLRTHQLPKFGFRFFHSDGRADFDRVLEVGITRYLAIPTYQIDRGIFENFLAEHAQQCGVRFLDGATVRGFTLEKPGRGDDRLDGRRDTPGDGHEVLYERGGAEHRIRARWLIDASGRAGLIKRQLGLAEPNDHDANGVWFRIGARLDVDEWSRDSEWLARCVPRDRWLSTSHLVGEGYWVWLIPLASGSHSVGIVADAKLHPLGGMSSFPRAMEWLHRHQPRLAEELETRRETLQDFAFLRRFSYGCKHVFSGSRWASTGEAGVFLDPFYSPGSDFIAIANTYITELIAKDRSGEPVEPFARIFERLYFSFYRSTLSLYLDQYSIFGDPEVLPIKVYWDYAYYWGVLCHLFVHGRIADVPMLGAMRGELASTFELNQAMQRFLRDWSRVSRKRNSPTIVDQNALGWFVELNRELRDELGGDAFKARLREHCALLHGLAVEILSHVAVEYPQVDGSALRALIHTHTEKAGAPPYVPLAPDVERPVALADRLHSSAG